MPEQVWVVNVYALKLLDSEYKELFGPDRENIPNGSFMQYNPREGEDMKQELRNRINERLLRLDVPLIGRDRHYYILFHIVW